MLHYTIIPVDHAMNCDVQELAQLLTRQWKDLTAEELRATQFNKKAIAQLIEQKYAINHVLAEHYLSNLERTLPMAA